MSARWQSTTVIPSTAEADISPSLLERARNVAAEHKKLSAANAESYDVDTAKRLGELGVIASALKEYEDAHNSFKRTSCHHQRSEW